MKKALLVTGIYFPDIGGPATFVPKLAKYLVNNNYDVTTFSLASTHNQVLPQEPWTRVFMDRSTPKIIRIPLTAWKIHKYIESETRIFANGLHEEVSIAALLSGRDAGVAKIVGDPIWERARNQGRTTNDIDVFNASRLKPIYILQRKFLTYCLNRYKVITTPSEHLKKIILSWGVKRPVIVINNGVDLPRKLKLEKTYDLCTVSRLVPWKNLELLLKACRELEISIAIVGSGPEEQNLRKLSKDCVGNIDFLGDLPSEEVLEVISKSRGYCLISSYEGLSFSLLEAMSVGTPVIVSNAEGNISVIESGKNGIVVSDLNEISIRQAVVDLLNDEEKQGLLSENARDTISRNYLLDSKLEDLRKLLES